MADAWNALNMLTNIALIILTVLLILQYYDVSTVQHVLLHNGSRVSLLMVKKHYNACCSRHSVLCKAVRVLLHGHYTFLTLTLADP